jgi:7-carboxy-7-deazaguanine synthase
MHAVDPDQIQASSRKMPIEDILREVEELPKVPWVTLSGGDPVAWDLTHLCLELKMMGYKVAVETQGALWNDWLEFSTFVTCSPKPPSSGMVDRLDIAILQKYSVRFHDNMVFKIVAFDDEDLDFVQRIHRAFPRIPMYITAGTPAGEVFVRRNIIEGFRKISESVLKRPQLFDVTVGIQQHALMYGRELGR